MRHPSPHPVLALALLLLGGCASGPRPLPIYEPPLPRAEVQSVRTTAYTHTEDDHVAYGNRNALGGTLRAAGPPLVAMAAAPVIATTTGAPVPATPAAGGFQASAPPPAAFAPIYGSAAADWSRWPAGTEFRLLSTGQLYRVDDYGWALAGRNTLDLYMPSRSAMNAWSVRREDIQIVRWGDPDESLRRLVRHQKYRHIRRMVLELEGNARAAARLQ